MQTLTLLHDLQHDPIRNAVFSPDGEHIISVDQSEVFIVWDVATGERLRVLRGVELLEIPSRTIEFSPNQSYVVATTYATSTDSESVITWNIEEGIPIKLSKSQKSSELLIASPFRYAFTTSPLRIWDIETGLYVSEWDIDVSLASFAPESGTLLTLSKYSGPLQLWQINSDQPSI